MRRNKAEKRQVIPDAQYNSEVVARLINMIMIDGKKAKAQGIVYGAFDMGKKQLKDGDTL